MFPRPIQQSSLAARIAYRAALPTALMLWMLPLAVVALTSLRSTADIDRGDVWSWPSATRLIENYGTVLGDSRLPQFILNSMLIAVPTAIATVLLAAMAGFALAKYRFWGNTLLLVVFIAGNLVPFQVLMIPVRSLMIETFGLYDTRWALILFQTAFQTGFGTLFMRNFIRQVPDAYIDAARIEGWSELAIFWRVVLPLVRPAMAAVAALVFTFVWNDYFWALVLVHSDDVRPVTIGLQSLRGMWVTSWNLVCAGSIMAALPPVALFALMQREFITGLTGTPDAE